MSRNTNAYLNALNQEHRKAVSNAFDAAENATRKILHASGTVKHIHPTIYDPASETIARNALYDASNASWKALLAASKTYQKGHAMTKEKQAAQKIYELQKNMSKITTTMDRFMDPSHMNNKPELRNRVHRGVLQAKKRQITHGKRGSNYHKKQTREVVAHVATVTKRATALVDLTVIKTESGTPVLIAFHVLSLALSQAHQVASFV